jgi:hypothetical protein
VVHDLDLPPHILHILLTDQLALADRLAGTVLPSHQVHHKPGDTELPLAQHLIEGILLFDVREAA